MNPFSEVWCQNPGSISTRLMKVVLYLHETKDEITYLFRWYASIPLDANKSRLNCPLICRTNPQCYQLLESVGKAGHWALMLSYSTTIHSTDRDKLLSHLLKSQEPEKASFHCILPRGKTVLTTESGHTIISIWKFMVPVYTVITTCWVMSKNWQLFCDILYKFLLDYLNYRN